MTDALSASAIRPLDLAAIIEGWLEWQRGVQELVPDDLLEHSQQAVERLRSSVAAQPEDIRYDCTCQIDRHDFHCPLHGSVPVPPVSTKD